MRFAPSPDQEALRALARQFFETESPMAEVRRVIETARTYDQDGWTQLAQLGLVGLAVPERFGGSGTSLIEPAIVLHEAGRALLPAPLLATTVAAGAFGCAAADGEAAAAWLPRIAEGEVIATLAVSDQHGRPELADTGVIATPAGPSWRLDGAKGFVVHGAAADLFLVTASTANGIALFAVPAGAGGLVVTALTALDPTRPLAAVGFSATPAELVCADGPAIERALQLAAVCLAAEQVGGAERCLEIAVEYAKNRVQFGRPIGSFQAIKHLLADVLVEVEYARAAVDYAAWAAVDSPAEVLVAAGVAKSASSDAYVQAASVNLQVHGGMGFTWEDDAHLHLKRAMAGKQLFGSPEWHREQIATAMLSPGRPMSRS